MLRTDHLTGGSREGAGGAGLDLSLPNTVLIPIKTTFIQWPLRAKQATISRLAPNGGSADIGQARNVDAAARFHSFDTRVLRREFGHSQRHLDPSVLVAGGCRSPPAH